MRARHVIAVVAAVLVGAGPTLISFAPTAEADALTIRSASVDVFQLHQKIQNLPVLRFRDMSVIFPGVSDLTHIFETAALISIQK
jgi:hypothetical protein